MNTIFEAEKELCVNMQNSAVRLLEESILVMCTTTNDFNRLSSVVNLQTAMELLLKKYIQLSYGFQSILEQKSLKLRQSDPNSYLLLLNKGDLKTLGFEKIKKLLSNQKDAFAPIIENGQCPCLGIEYDYLEGLIEKFQSLRNRFMHLGIELNDQENKWISTDFFAMTIMFITLLLREIKKISTKPGSMGSIDTENTDLFDTPTDILRETLTAQTYGMLIANNSFYNSMWDLYSDAYDVNCYVCTKCGKESMFLNVHSHFSKCMCCGHVIYANYVDCNQCQTEGAVIYDHLNIEINRNVMPAYCYNCQQYLKVYQCPVCKQAYAYEKIDDIEERLYDCCMDNFRDREIAIH